MEKSPDAFRTISEVAEQLGTPAHVLRFWESRFPQIKPVKRAGGRRYYRPADVALLSGIRRLLHDDGLTIRGVQKILREQGVRHVAALGGLDTAPPPAGTEADIEAVLSAEFGPPATEPAEPAAAQTAQVISLEAALARAEGRAAPPPPVPEAEPEEAPEAPFIEAEEDPLPAPVPLRAPVAAAPDAGAAPAAPESRDSGDDSEQPVETLGESTLASRLRAADPARLADRREPLLALRERMLDLRGRLAKGVRRRAK